MKTGVLTRGRRLNGAILFRPERTTKNLSNNRTFWDGLGQRFDNSETEDCLKEREGDEYHGNGSLMWSILTPNNCKRKRTALDD